LLLTSPSQATNGGQRSQATKSNVEMLPTIAPDNPANQARINAPVDQSLLVDVVDDLSMTLIELITHPPELSASLS
jgi:hypothetical protein